MNTILSKLTLIILFLVFCIQESKAQYANTEVVAKIKTEHMDEMVSVIAVATNTTEVHKSLRYEFSVFRTDTTNNISKNNQEGRFTLKANESIELSTVTIPNTAENKIVVLLLLYEEDKIVGKDRVAYNESLVSERKKKQESSSDDGVEIKGIVTEETKTKPGKDFYEFFYKLYTMNQINGNMVVGVYEKLSFGRSTIIQVKIEDNVVHECFGKPDEEYLEQMAKIAIRKVYKYFKEQKHTIIQY